MSKPQYIRSFVHGECNEALHRKVSSHSATRVNRPPFAHGIPPDAGKPDKLHVYAAYCIIIFNSICIVYICIHIIYSKSIVSLFYCHIKIKTRPWDLERSGIPRPHRPGFINPWSPWFSSSVASTTPKTSKEIWRFPCVSEESPVLVKNLYITWFFSEQPFVSDSLGSR
jgi:hypothetical protein